MKTESGECIVTPEMKKAISKLGTPVFAGVLKIEPCSLQEIILGRCKLPRVFVNQKAEQLFLYGRDIFMKSIVKGKKSGTVLVCNEKGEPLGIGKFEGETLKNVVDLGFYLRSEDSCQVSEKHLFPHKPL